MFKSEAGLLVPSLAVGETGTFRYLTRTAHLCSQLACTMAFTSVGRDRKGPGDRVNWLRNCERAHKRTSQVTFQGLPGTVGP